MPLKDRYQSEKWKEYQRTYQRSWHQRNKEKRLAKVYARKAAIHEYIQSIKNQLYCADCGERHPAALQFHHLNSEDKAFPIGKAVNRGFSLDSIKKEQSGPGIAGELEELNTLLPLSLEEQDAYNIQFGDS